MKKKIEKADLPSPEEDKMSLSLSEETANNINKVEVKQDESLIESDNQTQTGTDTDNILSDIILETLKNQFVPIDYVALGFPIAATYREKIKKLEERLEKVNPKNQNLIKKINYEIESLEKLISKIKLEERHFLIITVENVMKVAKENNWGLCKNLNKIYLYNGSYWYDVDENEFQKFLGLSALKMGVEKFTSKFYMFRQKLVKQFLSDAYLPAPEISKNLVLINLLNGTFEIGLDGRRLRNFNRNDFLTYQLTFEYDYEAVAPIFQAYLDRVLPDKSLQDILAEYLGYVFMRNGNDLVKLEKVLVLLGSGANGKSVFFEIVNALLGSKNVSTISLQQLTNSTGYFRAEIANKLVNYSSEISSTLDSSLFKQMASGEPIDARLPYGQPMVIHQYAKLIFNSNELPKEIENTNAYFRRFLIIPFEVTIHEAEQDKNLHNKIIRAELSGIFNWVLKGLERLLLQMDFTFSEKVKQARDNYEIESDSVRLFLTEMNYQASSSDNIASKNLYKEYKSFCVEDGIKPLNNKRFCRRLELLGFIRERKSSGYVFLITSDITRSEDEEIEKYGLIF